MLARMRSVWAGLRERRRIDAELEEEFRSHIALRAEDLVRDGMEPEAALRHARLEFGHVETHRQSAQAARGLHVLDVLGFSWLDAKLGARMAVKYPWLSGVSVLGMAVAIAIGAAAWATIAALMNPSLPLPDGERIVSLQNNTENPGNPDRRAIHDYFVWRDELGTLRDVSALLAERRNLIVDGQTPEVVSVARMSPSGFRVAGVAPLLGRALVEEDDVAGAAPVLVIGHAEWQSRFDGAPGVLGRTVRLGGTVHTVVGVMPEGFRFPINHGYWVPLQLNRSSYEPGTGPRVHVFARLADDATMSQAQAELEAAGRRLAAAYPETHGRLRPRVMPYTFPYADVDDPVMVLALQAVRVFLSLLLVLVAVNVAMLIYARTVTRAGEIVVRTALGASRRRIIAQLFVEALVLSGAAAVAGVSAAWFAMRELQEALERAAAGELPFWMRLELTPEVVAYVSGLAILAGIIVGVLPALRATGRDVQAGLQQISSRGSRMQLGRTWTLMIVSQVALAVAILPFVLLIASQALVRGTGRPVYPAEQMLQAQLSAERADAAAGTSSDAETAARRAGFARDAAELLLRLDAEPEVAHATYSSHVPGEGFWERMEVEPGTAGGNVVMTHVAPDLFHTFDVRVLAGRGFTDADTRAGASTAIVDQSFVQRYLQGEAVVGRRIRRVEAGPDGEPAFGEWLEIVGVVPNFTFQNDFDPTNAHVYRAVPLESLDASAVVIVRARGPASPGLAARLREHAAAVDPGLRVERLLTMAAADRNARRSLFWLGAGLTGAALSVLMLSGAGMYAMMSFTVARRRREIGIRSALGADPARVLRGLFARAAAQIGSGMAVGALLAAAIGTALGIGLVRQHGMLALAAVAALMTAVGLLAALGPARRSLEIEPTEAFRDD